LPKVIRHWALLGDVYFVRNAVSECALSGSSLAIGHTGKNNEKKSVLFLENKDIFSQNEHFFLKTATVTSN